jgi:hypothetical protein
MANRRGHRGRGGRPQRGHGGGAGGVLVHGDTGIAAGPQGGAQPGASESGNLEAREFGTPQADVPGGLKHLVNPETVAAEPIDKPPRPADYHNEHGVEPPDWGQFERPSTEDEDHKPPAAEHIPEADLAIPVYLVEGKGEAKQLLALVTEGPVSFPSGTTDPQRLANRDRRRRKFWIANEATPNPAGSTNPGVRIGDWDTCADGRGLLIGAGQIKDFATKEAVYLTNQSGTAVTISWGYETDTPASTSGT